MEKQFQQFIDEKREEIKSKYNDELDLLYEDFGNGSFRLMIKLKGYNNSYSWAYMGRLSDHAFSELKRKFDEKAHEIAESKWK